MLDGLGRGMANTHGSEDDGQPVNALTGTIRRYLPGGEKLPPWLLMVISLVAVMIAVSLVVNRSNEEGVVSSDSKFKVSSCVSWSVVALPKTPGPGSTPTRI